MVDAPSTGSSGWRLGDIGITRHRTTLPSGQGVNWTVGRPTSFNAHVAPGRRTRQVPGHRHGRGDRRSRRPRRGGPDGRPTRSRCPMAGKASSLRSGARRTTPRCPDRSASPPTPSGGSSPADRRWADGGDRDVPGRRPVPPRPPGGDDPVSAHTAGVGHLLLRARDAGATRIVVGCGGSATTDGGWGAVQVVGRAALAGVDLQVACDVTTRFVDAAAFSVPRRAPSPEQVDRLTDRLRSLADRYRHDFGVDVTPGRRRGGRGPGRGPGRPGGPPGPRASTWSPT